MKKIEYVVNEKDNKKFYINDTIRSIKELNMDKIEKYIEQGIIESTLKVDLENKLKNGEKIYSSAIIENKKNQNIIFTSSSLVEVFDAEYILINNKKDEIKNVFFPMSFAILLSMFFFYMTFSENVLSLIAVSVIRVFSLSLTILFISIILSSIIDYRNSKNKLENIILKVLRKDHYFLFKYKYNK